jgi:hypothetical protein
MKILLKFFLVSLLILSACKESPKQAWQRASNKLRDASRIYTRVSESASSNGKSRTTFPNAPDNPENKRTVNILLMAYMAAFTAKECTETADKLETFARFENPTSEQFAEVVKALDDLMKSAENSTTNPILLSIMRPDERQGFIDAQSLVKQANEIANNSKPSDQSKL